MTLFKMAKEAIAYKEVKARCPICKMEYKYPKGIYQPPTCDNFDCVQAYLHPELSIRQEGNPGTIGGKG